MTQENKKKTTNTKKKQLACWVSKEIAEKVKALTEGDDAPFEGVSAYLSSLIIADLGRREMGADALSYKIFEIMSKPEFQEKFLEAMGGIRTTKKE